MGYRILAIGCFELFLPLLIMAVAGKFQREDLARALLNFFVLDIVQCLHLVSKCHGIKRVFFCGSFASTPLVRHLITTEFVRRNLHLMIFASVTHLSFLLIHFATSVYTLCNNNNTNIAFTAFCILPRRAAVLDITARDRGYYQSTCKPKDIIL